MRDIKELRKVLHLTQKELAKKLKVHTLTVSRWERGIRKPQAQYERKMERLLKRRIKYLADVFTVGITSNSRTELMKKFAKLTYEGIDTPHE
jgi:transcriptional regulator with XRE-family HTH domain